MQTCATEQRDLQTTVGNYAASHTNTQTHEQIDRQWDRQDEKRSQTGLTPCLQTFIYEANLLTNDKGHKVDCKRACKVQSRCSTISGTRRRINIVLAYIVDCLTTLTCTNVCDMGIERVMRFATNGRYFLKSISRVRILIDDSYCPVVWYILKCDICDVSASPPFDDQPQK